MVALRAWLGSTDPLIPAQMSALCEQLLQEVLQEVKQPSTLDLLLEPEAALGPGLFSLSLATLTFSWIWILLFGPFF